MLTPKQREMWRVNKYIWASLGFVLVWLLAQWSHYPAGTQDVLAAAFVVAFTNLILRSWIAFRSPAGTTGQWGWAFSIIDIALIAVAVRVTGRAASDLWLLYILLSVTETLSAAVKAELLLLLLVSVGYALALWPIGLWGTFLTRLFFIYVVSAIARRLHLNAEERRRQLTALREQLSVEEEKSRVARELHDGLGREIVNVILGLEVARRVAVSAPEEIPPMLEENIALLRVAMNDTRDLIFQMRPWTLDTEGGSAAFADRLERYARQFAARTGLEVVVECEINEGALNPHMAFGLLRILQESLNNIAKHAHASTVSLRLRSERDSFVAIVTDNGIGFTKLQNLVKTGIGLQSMRERAQDLNGILDVTSHVGKGTVVTVRIPA
jgi:signal transduction histidine kinase